MQEIVLKRMMEYYNSILNSPEGQWARDYLESRGINLAIANSLMIGATPPVSNPERRWETNGLTSHLLGECQISVADVATSLMSRHVDNGSDQILVDYFGINRIIFPSLLDANPVFFSSRSVEANSSLPHMHVPCRMYPHIWMFNQNVLSGSSKNIFLVEGPIDTSSMVMLGNATVGTYGTAGVRPEHKHLFVDVNKNYIFVFDNDENNAGNTATLKSAGVLKSFGCNNLFRINLPRKEGTRKIDINKILVEAGLEKTKKWFDARDIIPINNVEPYYAPVGIKNWNRTDNSKILEVVSKYVSIERAGEHTYKAICPFHDDTNPSFHIWPESNSCHCFSPTCRFNQSSGNGPVQFLMEYFTLEWKDAKQRLEDEFGG